MDLLHEEIFKQGLKVISKRIERNDIHLPIQIRLLNSQIRETNDILFATYKKEHHKLSTINLKYTSHILEYLDQLAYTILDTYPTVCGKVYLHWIKPLEDQDSFIKTLNITQEKILKDWKALIETVKETERLYASIKVD